jgi:predicted homoserine dehydrogenase-like protein
LYYSAKLEKLSKKNGKNYKIAVVGVGQMGRGFASQCNKFPGLDVACLVDLDIDRIKKVFKEITKLEPVISGDLKTLLTALENNQPIGLTDISLISKLPLDVVVEATGVPEIGAQVTESSLKSKKHVAVLNVECDVTIGPLLKKIAGENNVIYTVCHGDEPIEAKALVDFARDLSFEVICAGKGKNNPFEPLSTPDTVAEKAKAQNMNPKMLCSFTDGSKTMIEMAALANATGLKLTKRGMLGPETTVKKLQETYALKKDGGILEEAGVVDYCTGDVAPGVFVVIKTDDEYVSEEMTYLKMGSGPYFALHRPYHLASVEAPISIAKILLDNEPSLVCEERITEVIAATKKDLMPGDVLDGIGGYCYRGIADIREDAEKENLVPIGLLQNAKVKKPLSTGQLISWDDVEIDESQTIVRLRKEQDALGL